MMVLLLLEHYSFGSARDLMVIVAVNEHCDSSSNPEWRSLQFTEYLAKLDIRLFSLQLWANSKADWALYPW